MSTSSIVVEAISSGTGGTVVGLSRGEATEPGTVEEEWCAVAGLYADHMASDQFVVAPVVDGAERALDMGQRSFDDRCAGHRTGRPLDSVELVTTRNGEGAADGLLVLLEDVHAEGAGLRDAGPAGRAPCRRQYDHGWIE